MCPPRVVGRSAGTADLVTVVANETTVVDDSLRPPGSVTDTARHATTREPVNSFCAGVSGVFDFPCTDTGSVTFPTVLPGRYMVSVYPNDQTYLSTDVKGVMVASGQTTTVVADVERSGIIQTSVRDAATGAPVANACVEPIEPLHPSQLGTRGGWCSDEAGQVTINRIKAGTYNLFTWARDGEHGHQWVGYS